MATEAKEQLELDVSEEKDGSAVVDLPKDLLSDEEEGQTEAEPKVKEEAAESDADIEDHPDDTEALKAAKREKRRARRHLLY